MNSTKTSLVPDEDQGVLFVNVSTAPGSSLKTTDDVMLRIEERLEAIPQKLHIQKVAGYGLLSGQGNTFGMIVMKLKPWDERKSRDMQLDAVMAKAFAFNATHPGVTLMALNPPPIPGLGNSGGFTLYIQNKSGDSNENMQAVIGKFLAAANQRPEIQMAYTTFRMDTPSYNYDIDREKAARNGVNVGDIFTALQAYYGSVQINDFTIYGRNYKVVAQADTQYRMSPNDNKFLMVKDNKGNMVPISNFITPKKSNAIAVITRYNNFPAVKIGGSQAAGYSSGRQDGLCTGFGHALCIPVPGSSLRKLENSVLRHPWYSYRFLRSLPWCICV